MSVIARPCLGAGVHGRTRTSGCAPAGHGGHCSYLGDGSCSPPCSPPNCYRQRPQSVLALADRGDAGGGRSANCAPAAPRPSGRPRPLRGGGVLAAGIGWWEIQYGELGWVALFRGRITRVGLCPFDRPFDYANQTAMFIEATLPLLARGWHIYHSAWPRWVKIPLLMGVGVTAVGYLHASVLTLSRASFATIVIVCLLVAVWLAIPRTAHGRQMALWWLGLGVLAAVITLGANLVEQPNAPAFAGRQCGRMVSGRGYRPRNADHRHHSVLVVPVVSNNGSFAWHSEGKGLFSWGHGGSMRRANPHLCRIAPCIPRPVEAGDPCASTLAQHRTPRGGHA